MITLQEKDLIVKSGYDPAFDIAGQFFQIWQKASGECYYLSIDNKCTIQGVKPGGCRTFPITKFYSQTDGQVCTGICIRCSNIYSLPKSFVDASLEELKRIDDQLARVWNDQDRYPIRPFHTKPLQDI